MRHEKKTIEEFGKKYDFELGRIISEVKKSKAKIVLLQFPDGLKPYATAVCDYLEEAFKGKVHFLIWLGSCFGACDIPAGVERISPKIDLAIQFGHNAKMPDYIK